jgi:hypothetical protein
MMTMFPSLAPPTPLAEPLPQTVMAPKKRKAKEDKKKSTKRLKTLEKLEKQLTP